MKTKYFIPLLLVLFLQEIKSQNTKSLGISIEPSLEKAIYWTKSKDFKTPASIGFRMGVCYQVDVPKFKYSIGLTYTDRALKHQQNNLIFGTDIRGGTTSSMKSITQVKEIGVGGLVQRKVKDNSSSKWQPHIGGGLEINKTVKNTNHSWIALGNGELENIASLYTRCSSI